MLITLIVPFCNEERHLHRSICSIQQQVLTDYEVLLIDDLSTDGSYALAANLTQGDERFRLLRNEHKGLHYARNLALSEARGEYICFLDADDELLPDYLSGLYADSQQSGADMVVQGFTRVSGRQQSVTTVSASGTYHLPQAASSLFSSFDVFLIGNVFGKLYRRQLIQEHQLMFSPLVYQCEDLYFVLSFLAVCHTIQLSQVSHYRYIAHQTSMSTHYWNYETECDSFRQLISAWNRLLMFFPCQSLQISYGAFYGYYVHRLLISSLMHPARQTFRDEQLFEIEHSFAAEYSQHFHPFTHYTRCLKWTFLHHHYHLFRLIVQTAHLRYGIQVRYL